MKGKNGRVGKALFSIFLVQPRAQKKFFGQLSHETKSNFPMARLQSYSFRGTKWIHYKIIYRLAERARPNSRQFLRKITISTDPLEKNLIFSISTSVATQISSCSLSFSTQLIFLRFIVLFVVDLLCRIAMGKWIPNFFLSL